MGCEWRSPAIDELPLRLPPNMPKSCSRLFGLIALRLIVLRLIANLGLVVFVGLGRFLENLLVGLKSLIKGVFELVRGCSVEKLLATASKIQ